MAIPGGPGARKMAVAVATALLLIAGACGGGDKQVTGLVLEVAGRDVIEIESLRLRDDDGRVWEFATEGPVGLSAAHLRQHQLAGEKVVVTYRAKDGRLIASDIRDAPSPGGQRISSSFSSISPAVANCSNLA